MTLHRIDKRLYLVEISLRMDLVVGEDGREIVARVKAFNALFHGRTFSEGRPKTVEGIGS